MRNFSVLKYKNSKCEGQSEVSVYFLCLFSQSIHNELVSEKVFWKSY